MNYLQTIPTIFKAIITGAIVILTITVTYPIANHILGLFETGSMMKYASVLIFWIIIIFVTWFLVWVQIFRADTTQGG